MAKRLALLALLAGVLAAVSGPHDAARAAVGKVQDLMPSWQPLWDRPQPLSERGTTRVGTEAWRTRAEDTVPSRTRRTGP